MSPTPPRPLPRAILCDLDGTLYSQSPLRRRMLVELCLVPISRLAPREGLTTLRRLSRFRKLREELRELGQVDESLDELQYRRPAEALGEKTADLRATVLEWMHERPLRHLRKARRPGVKELFKTAHRMGIEVGVFSDYPAQAKLIALELDMDVSLVLAATDSEVNAFKPHAAGFLLACKRWGLAPEEVLYIGDREEVDHAGATAAGLSCALVGEETIGHPSHTTYADLRDRFERAH